MTAGVGCQRTANVQLTAGSGSQRTVTEKKESFFVCQLYYMWSTIMKGAVKNDFSLFTAPMLLVKAVRVELTSESISTGTSPSAAFDFSFAHGIAQKQAISRTIPLVPCATGRSHRVFLHNRRRDPDLQVNPGRRRAAQAAAELSSECVSVFSFSVYI